MAEPDQPTPLHQRQDQIAAQIPAVARPAWEGWAIGWHGLFVLLLIASAGVGLTDPLLGGAQKGALLLGSTLLLGWYSGFTLMLGHQPRLHPLGLRLIYLGGFCVLWFWLTGIHQFFFLLLSSLYPQLYMILPIRVAVPCALLVTLLVSWRHITLVAMTAGEMSLYIFLTFLVAMSGIFAALWVNAVISQSCRRQQLLDELEATRRDLAAAERQAGVLAERQRLAGEIHDTLAQGFTSIVMHLEAAEQALPPASQRVLQHLDQARHTARESLAESRRLVWALRAEVLEQSPLPEALTRVSARWTKESAIPVTTTITGSAFPLPPDAEMMLLRTTQEALNNVRKHASATAVSLTLSYMPDLVMLDVQDDGVGFRPGMVPQTPQGDDRGGYGLIAMRTRVEQLGGSLLIESAPGEGSTLVVELPLPFLTTQPHLAPGQRIS